MTTNAPESIEQSTTRPLDPMNFRSLYLQYVRKAENLEHAAEVRALEIRQGNPQLCRTDQDRVISADPEWKKYVADQQFAERHANMYAAGATMQTIELWMQSVTRLQRMNNEILAELRNRTADLRPKNMKSLDLERGETLGEAASRLLKNS